MENELYLALDEKDDRPALDETWMWALFFGVTDELANPGSPPEAVIEMDSEVMHEVLLLDPSTPVTVIGFDPAQDLLWAQDKPIESLSWSGNSLLLEGAEVARFETSFSLDGLLISTANGLHLNAGEA